MCSDCIAELHSMRSMPCSMQCSALLRACAAGVAVLAVHNHFRPAAVAAHTPNMRFPCLPLHVSCLLLQDQATTARVCGPAVRWWS